MRMRLPLWEPAIAAPTTEPVFIATCETIALPRKSITQSKTICFRFKTTRHNESEKMPLDENLDTNLSKVQKSFPFSPALVHLAFKKPSIKFFRKVEDPKKTKRVCDKSLGTQSAGEEVIMAIFPWGRWNKWLIVSPAAGPPAPSATRPHPYLDSFRPDKSVVLPRSIESGFRLGSNRLIFTILHLFYIHSNVRASFCVLCAHAQGLLIGIVAFLMRALHTLDFFSVKSDGMECCWF